MTNEELGIPEYSKPKKKHKKSIQKPHGKCDALKQLDVDFMEWKYRDKHIPPELQIKPNHKEDCTNEMTKSVEDFFHCHGHAAVRINTQGNYNAAIGKYTYSGSTNGVEDVQGVVFGQLVAVELKRGSDRQSQDQFKRQLSVEASGGIYFIPDDFTDFVNTYESIIDKTYMPMRYKVKTNNINKRTSSPDLPM